MDLIISKRRKYKIPIIIIASTAVVIVSIIGALLIYLRFFYGTGPVAGCEKKAMKVNDEDATLNYYVCKRELFTFQVHEDIAYDLPLTYLDDFHNWFKNEVTYGPEIETFKTIRLTTWAGEGNKTEVGSYADYVPQQSHINLYYDVYNPERIKSVANLIGDNNMNRYDLRLWKYTVSHEYGHHMTVKNMSDNRIIDRNGTKDVALSQNGNKFFTENGYSDKNEFRGQGITGIIPQFGGTVDTSTNKYYWTYAEMLTRELQTYTHNGRDSQLFTNDTLSKFWGGPLSDSAWRQYYSLLGYTYNTQSKLISSLKAGQKNVSAIEKYVFGANDNPLHAVYSDTTGYVLNTASAKYTLLDAQGKEVKPTSTKEYSNFWYNNTFLDGETRNDIDTERYALTFNLKQGTTYTLDLKGDNPANAGMGLEENSQSTIYLAVNPSKEFVTVKRGTGNNYSIQVH